MPPILTSSYKGNKEIGMVDSRY